MKDLSAIADDLTGFAHEQNLVARALDGCSAFLKNEAQENGLPRQLSPSDIKSEFRSHSLTFESSLLSYPYVSTRLDLYAAGEEVGWYKLIVRLDGQNEDDYLVFYPERKDG
jgi:hypothetical protein